MINPVFSKKVLGKDENTFVLPKKYCGIVANINASLDTGPELRLQREFGNEIWMKLDSLGLKSLPWSDMSVLDLCAGTGFLSYHILAMASPKQLDLIDISNHEINLARELLSKRYRKSNTNINYIVGDILKFKSKQRYDLIVGNSFIHHLYDVTGGLKDLKKLIKPGGYFVSLHEPTPMAVALESGKYSWVYKSIKDRKKFIDGMRPTLVEMSNNPGGDVWLFEKRELKNLFENAGYQNVSAEVFNFMRPLKVARHNMHLTADHKKLDERECKIFANAIKYDLLLKRALPTGWFGSIAIVAKNE